MTPEQFLNLARLLPEPMLLASSDGLILSANPPLTDILGLSREALQSKSLIDLTDETAEKTLNYLRACSRSRQMVIDSLRLRCQSGQILECRSEGAVARPWSPDSSALVLLRFKPKSATSSRFIALNQKIDELAKEVMERKRVEALLQGQKRVLELIAQSAPLSDVLDTLVRVIEEQSIDGLLGSILLVDEDGLRLRHGAAPSLPETYNQMIDGIAIGPSVGSCGTAAHIKEAVIVSDISSDPLWKDFRDLAFAHDLRACWSTPIFSTQGRVLGTFAMYYKEPQSPEPRDLEIISLVTRTAAIAIERRLAEQAFAQLLARERKIREEAETANRAKDQFLATISHELRNPLNAILGWSRLLTMGKLDMAGVARAIETIDRNAKAQTQLIEDLLDVSRIITGKLRLDVRKVELIPVIEAAIDSVRPAADAKHIRLLTALDPKAGPVSGDPARLQQIVWNLLSNAVKFTPSRGRVQIRLERVNSHVEITVSDTGCGIKQDFLPYVFDRFSQADSTLTRSHSGLGLGLAIVRHLTEQHGGSAHAYSAGENSGSSFTIKLPIMVVQDVERFPAEIGLRVHPTAQSDEMLDSLPMLDGLHVLVVDDDADARDLLRTVLTKCGARVTSAASAADALDAIESLKPDVMVSDIEMPNEDGYSLIRRVRAKEENRGGRIPAAALTAHARIEDRMRALSAGYQIHIPKPVEFAELVMVVASLAGRIGTSDDT